MMDARRGSDTENDSERARAAVAAAHTALRTEGFAAREADEWRRFLRWSARPAVLEALDEEARRAWAEDAAVLLAELRYTLGDLLDDRAEECGDEVYLESLAEGRRLTYAETRHRVRRIAAALRAAAPSPRVLIFAANAMETALCDLACLCHDILVAPVSVHTDTEDLAWMIGRLGITIVITDSPERLQAVINAAASGNAAPRIVVTDRESGESENGVLYLDDLVAEYGHEPLPAREVDPFATATVMFTSGSTGRPKGVCFSQHAMLSKRFARAAALPAVGRDETLLAYLPLFHTFGRFLELQGMLFWRGRYVFAQDGSRDSLLAGIRAVQPTGLIGVPLRWTQLADEAKARMAGLQGASARAAFRTVCGPRLRWGLSAAGYLDPKIFQFFHSLGVELCSGFGMTEATGGILMTPPGGYEAGAVGVPLPLVEVRRSAQHELQVRGPYVAMPLDTHDGADAELPDAELPGAVVPGAEAQEQPRLPRAVPSARAEEHPWFATGDVFARRASGQYEIVDRLKDIYKNSRGQTVSPAGIEKLFHDIPGFRRVFVAGDGREFNVLLIVPDTAHALFSAAHDDDERDASIREIIRAGNALLAPFERVVRYALLDRDFDMEKGERTPKGSFNRATVARNFAETIDALYRTRDVVFTIAGLTVRIPHWLLRELGVTEHDLVAATTGIHNRATGALLSVAAGRDQGMSWIIGDLEYECPGSAVDLGILCRQPLGWVGNPALADVFPCREGWDAALPGGMRVRCPEPIDSGSRESPSPDRHAPRADAEATRGVSHRLRRVHQLLSTLLHGMPAQARALIDDAAMELDHGGRHVGGVVRARLAALAWHDDDALRCAAYAALLLYDPHPEEREAYAEFVRSGRPFLTDDSIRGIAARDLRHGRLTALRARLRRYREDGVFEGEQGRAVVRGILALLVNLAERDAAYVFEVRAELCHWMRHEAERGIRKYGSDILFERLRQHYHARHAGWLASPADVDCLRAALRYDESVPTSRRERIALLFATTPFLPLSLLMLHEIPAFSCARIADGGIWISALPEFGAGQRYLVSIATRDARQYQLQLLLLPERSSPELLAGMHVFIALSGAATGPRVLPRFGSYMPEAGAVSMQYVRGATVWDDMQRLDLLRAHPAETARRLRVLVVHGMAAFISAWRQSGGSVIPGAAHPANVSVPDECVRGTAMIRSIDGWRACDGPVTLWRALRHHFHDMTAAHMPRLRPLFDEVWICEAAREALGDHDGMAFIETLLGDDAITDAGWYAAARSWLEAMRTEWLPPLALDSAVACYREWDARHDAPALALRERYARDLARLFDIDRLGELGRYALYRRTVFADTRAETAEAFDALLADMHRAPSTPPARLPAMNRLLDSLRDDDERHAVLRLVSPSADVSRHTLLAVAGVRVLQRRIEIRSGESFILRDAVGATEIGQLYDLFLREQFPVVTGARMLYLVLVDEWHRIEGGAGYAFEDDGSLSVELLIVDPAVRGQGLGAAVIDELIRRATDAGARQLRAPYYLRRFCLRMGFVDDADNGDLRRDL